MQRAKQLHHIVPKIGDVVLVGSDNQKRQQRPIAQILELITRRSGVIRITRVKISHELLTRPLQCLLALEMSTHEETILINKSSNDGSDD